MHYDPVVRRVVVVILDGLRPDAIQRFHLETLHRLMASGAWTLRGTTVAPSVTTAAVTSLMTGVSPATRRELVDDSGSTHCVSREKARLTFSFRRSRRSTRSAQE